MSRISIALLSLAGLMAVGSQAQAATDAPLTREQVRAEYLQARAQGRLSPTGEVGYVAQVNKAKSSVTRNEVMRELAANGPQNTAEGSDVGNNRATVSVRSRAEVHAEAHRAVRDRTQGGGKL